MSEMIDLIEQLEEHAARVAGGTSGESNYDPETLCLEMDAAAMLKRCMLLHVSAAKVIRTLCAASNTALPKEILSDLENM